MASDTLKNTHRKTIFCRYAKRAFLPIFCIVLLSSCSSRYFSPLPVPGETLKIKELGDLPYRESWQGFVFNGEKVGFVHLKKDEVVDSFSAVEVLHARKGECQAHAMLYTAMARAAGIPTKLVGGLVYMEGMGFLYHSWAESYADEWIVVDPTFNQAGVDATHIKLVEGHDWTSLLQIGKVVGQIKVKISDYVCGQ